MTTPPPTQAELEAAAAIITCYMPQLEFRSQKNIAQIIAAHRAEPPADPAQVHAAELESTLRALTKHMDGTIGARYAENARALLATLDAERKAQMKP